MLLFNSINVINCSDYIFFKGILGFDMDVLVDWKVFREVSKVL